jgi:Fic family protein
MNKTETKTGYIVLLEDYLKNSEEEQNEFLEDLVIESNAIEGIYNDRVVTINEGEEPPPYYEFTDHHSALNYVLGNYKKNDPTEQDIKHIHKLLTENVFREESEYIIHNNELTEEEQKKVLETYQRNSGNYRQTKVWIGSKMTGYQGTPYYRQIPKLMKGLEKQIQQLPNLSIKDIWNLHHKFETIHPFVDGNGRTGRLFLNWLSLKYHGEFIVNTKQKVSSYYDEIRSYTEQFKLENHQVHFYKDIPPRKDDFWRAYANVMLSKNEPKK